MLLEAFLEQKPLFYKKFDPTRIVKAYDTIKEYLPTPTIVHLIGTNGKGSTGRYLAQMLQQVGQNVGHYTSPHIKKFNERIWLNGEDASDQLLDAAFKELIEYLPLEFQESLSYFEFTTLVAMFAFKECDYVVMEAGLGGEFDATSVFENSLTLLTPIGLDHAAFLGTTIEEVATTKIRGVQKHVISALQKEAVVEILHKLSEERSFEIIPLEDVDGDKSLIEKFSEKNDVDYLVRNFSLALKALRVLGFKQQIHVEEIATIFGRLTKIMPNIRVDVGHNLLAASEIAKFYGNSKVNLVYNTLEDKAYEEILKLLKPNIEKVLIISIDDERALKREILEETIGILNDITIIFICNCDFIHHKS